MAWFILAGWKTLKTCWENLITSLGCWKIQSFKEWGDGKMLLSHQKNYNCNQKHLETKGEMRLWAWWVVVNSDVLERLSNSILDHTGFQSKAL
jgi:hypothetical protein